MTGELNRLLVRTNAAYVMATARHVPLSNRTLTNRSALVTSRRQSYRQALATSVLRRLLRPTTTLRYATTRDDTTSMVTGTYSGAATMKLLEQSFTTGEMATRRVSTHRDHSKNLYTSWLVLVCLPHCVRERLSISIVTRTYLAVT